MEICEEGLIQKLGKKNLFNHLSGCCCMWKAISGQPLKKVKRKKYQDLSITYWKKIKKKTYYKIISHERNFCEIFLLTVL